MEITLKSIVEYLNSTDKPDLDNADDNKKEENDITLNLPVPLPPGDIEKPEQFSEWLKSIFIQWNNKIQRIGISGGTLYDAIFYCIDSKFENLTPQKQQEYLKNIRTTCYKKLSKSTKKNSNSDKNDLFQEYDYVKLGWKKTTIVSIFKNGEQTMEVLRFFTDYFCINIILIDPDDRQIQLHFGHNSKFCPFKETVILIRTKKGADPVISEDIDKRTWNYNDDFFKEFLDKYRKQFICPSYTLNKNEDIYRPFILMKPRDDESDEEIEKITDVLNKSMKLDKIQVYAKKYGISIKMGKKYKTKQMLCEEIKNKIKEV
jgi:hypothetical protein